MWDHVEMLLHQSAGSEDAVMQGFVNSKLEWGLFNKLSENNVALSSRLCKCAHIYMQKRENVDECMHVCTSEETLQRWADN